jgi:hypothetical protein
LSNEF